MDACYLISMCICVYVHVHARIYRKSNTIIAVDHLFLGTRFRGHSESLIVLPALLLDEWSAAKCAAWRNGSMSSTPMDGFDSTSLKRKYDEVERAATKKALKRRLTVRQHADV